MTDLLDDERYWTGNTVLDEYPDVLVTPDDLRPAYDGDDDGYEYSDGAL